MIKPKNYCNMPRKTENTKRRKRAKRIAKIVNDDLPPMALPKSIFYLDISEDKKYNRKNKKK